MKKIYIIIVVMLIIATAGIYIVSKSNTKVNEVNEIYEKYRYDVDAGIDYFFKSNEFSNMDKDVQIEKMEMLLKKYEENGSIVDLNYSTHSKVFSFKHNIEEQKGIYGGVSFQEYEIDINGEKIMID